MRSRNEALARWTEKLNIAQENIREVTKQLKYGAIGGFGISSHALVAIYRLICFRYVRLSNWPDTVEEYQDALWALAVKYPDFTENAEEIQEQVLALQAAELAAQRAGDQLDRLRSGVTQTAAAQANPQAPQAPTQPAAPQQLGDKEEENPLLYSGVGSRRSRLTSCYCVARSSEGAAVENALVLNEQEQALRRLGIDLSNNQSAGAQEYEQRIRNLIGNKYELEEADTRAREAAERHEDTVEDITRAFNALNLKLNRPPSKPLNGAKKPWQDWIRPVLAMMNSALRSKMFIKTCCVRRVKKICKAQSTGKMVSNAGFVMF